MPLSKLQNMQLNAARIVGGSPSVYVTNGELAYLLCVACMDLGLQPPAHLLCETCLQGQQHLYATPLNLATCRAISDDKDGNIFIETVLGELAERDPDTFTYFWALTVVHAHRRKYRAILDEQPIPSLQTVMPRGLLELGALPLEELASWLVWRKYLYDIDNRSAQITGYLFEPILAASIGGLPYSAKRSPIRRLGTGSGRQVDCIINHDAYEFKMRVTIAASGQGRFAEELSYAQDCHLSGYRPILLVLDPTPSTKLDELSQRYLQFNGEVYIGSQAWRHLEDKAGRIMAVFLDRYIHQPLSTFDRIEDRLMPFGLSLDKQSHRIMLTVGDSTYLLAK